VQRGGPSTGLPTKTEQADLLQAVCGRNGECPVPVLTHGTPAEGFEMIQEAFRIAVEFMTPVLFLSDGYLANSAEPWRIPMTRDLKAISVPTLPDRNGDPAPFLPYARDERLARPWAPPGLVGYEHRIGGLEKEHVTGNVCYEGDNHEFMIRLRQRKVDGIADHIPLQTVDGPESGDLLVISWGSPFGAVSTAVAAAQRAGRKVAHMQLRYLNPMPRNLGDVFKRFKRILVAELNLGQLRMLLRARYLVDAQGYNKVKGQPFSVAEIAAAIDRTLAG
jgi:2-oxoglutarate ferredoxin oxidoreductase subunit alpha